MVFFKHYRCGSLPRQPCAARCLRCARVCVRDRVRVRVHVHVRLVAGIQGVTNRRVLSWALKDFAPVVEVPVSTCQRADCKACAKYASADDALSRPYRDHQSPSRRDLDIEVKQAARVRWRDQYAAQVDAQVTSRMSECPELDEQDLRAAITKQVEVEMETAVRVELAAARFLPKLRTCTRCWTGEIQSRREIIDPPCLSTSSRRMQRGAHMTNPIVVAVAYCSKECQTADWSLHKTACTKRSKPAKPEGVPAAAGALVGAASTSGS